MLPKPFLPSVKSERTSWHNGQRKVGLRDNPRRLETTLLATGPINYLGSSILVLEKHETPVHHRIWRQGSNKGTAVQKGSEGSLAELLPSRLYEM